MLLPDHLYPDYHPSTFRQSFPETLTREGGQWEITPVCDRFLSECSAIVCHHIEDPLFGVDALAKKLGMSHSALYKKIKAISGGSASELVRIVRLKYAAEMLIHSVYNINEVAYHAGFSDVKYFRKQFKRLYDLTPSSYRKHYRVDPWDTIQLNRRTIQCSIVWTGIRTRGEGYPLPICPP